MRLKQLVLNQKGGPLDKFDKEMRAALVDRPDLQPIYARMDSREMQNFFNDLLEHPPEKAGNQYPRWVRLKKSYYNSVPTHWEIMYPMASRDWHGMYSTDREEYLANGMKKFVRDYGLPALKTWGHTVRGHPEFKFEAVEDPDFDANEYMHMIPFGACRNCSADLTLPYTVVRYYTPRGEGAAQGFCYGHTTTEGEYEPDGSFSGGDITQFDLHANSDFCTRCGLSLTEDETAPPVEEALEDPDFDADEYMSSVDLPTFKDWLKAQSFVTRPGGAERTDDLGNIQVIRIRGQWEFRIRNRGVFRYVRIDDADDATLIAALEDFISKSGIQETVDRLLEDDPDFDADEYMASEDVGFLLASVQGAWIYEPTEDMILKFCKTNSPTTWGAFERHEGPLYYIVPKETGKGNFLLGVAEEGRLYAPPYYDSRAVADKFYKAYPGLRRFFHKVAKELIDGDYTERGIRLMAQLYGPKAILKYVDDYNVPVDLRFRVGVEAAVTGKLDDAAALLKISVQQLTSKGAKWLLRDDSELAKLFDRNEQGMAKEAINGEFDASGAYDVDLELDEIVSALRDEDYAAIRELLPHRTVYPYEDEQPLRLSTQNLQEFGNEDIADWLRDEAMETYDLNGELQDIRKALDSAAHSALEHIMVDVATEAYKKAALDAIDGELAYTEKGTVLFVPWKIIDIWLSNEDVSEAGDLDDLLWYYSPRASAPEDCYNGADWDDQERDPFYSELENVLDGLEMPAYPYDSKQLTMPEIMGDDPSEIVEVPYYGPHTPHGYSLRLRRMDMEKRKKMEEPWHFDKDLWQQHARETGFEIPPAPGVGESVANTLLEQEYKYASTQIDVPAEQGDFLFEWGRLNIPDERLQVADPDDNPRELQHHVTVKFGLTVNDVPEELRAICKEIQPFPVYIGKVSLFHNQGFDVVKLDVESPWLRELNAKISAAVPNEDTHPTYIPHITVAYVKPGSCDELEGVDIFQGDESGVSPEFVAYGLAFKGAGEDGGPRTEENLLFSRIKKKAPVGPSESEPFNNLPFPLDPAHTAQFLQATRSRARREIL
jgi:hypothetical protein